MKGYKIVDMPLAQADIRTILDYLDTFSLDIALKYAEFFDDAISSLSTMPERCPFVRNESLKAKGYRWLSVRNYTIFFTIDESANVVRIERILYSRREYDVIL